MLSAMLDSSVYTPVDLAVSAGEAKRKLLTGVFDIIIIDPPLPDEFGADFAVDISETTSSGIMIIVRSDLFELITSKVENAGVLTLSKPLSRKDFYTALKLITATSARILNGEKKVRRLQEKLEEIKLVSRAKFILMENQKLSEQEAHRYIEKEAMNRRITKSKMALEIIDNSL